MASAMSDAGQALLGRVRDRIVAETHDLLRATGLIIAAQDS